MKETKLQPKEIAVVQGNNGLELYLSGLLTGHGATDRTSLYNIKGKTEVLEPDEILERWKTKLESLSSGTEFEQNVFQFDSAQLQKWGPQGQVAPISELMKDVVLPSFSTMPKPSAFSSDYWQTAKAIVVRRLKRAGCRGLTPVPYHRVIDDMRARDTLESNSGWPLFARRHKQDVITQSIEAAEDGQWKTFPAIALFRNYNQKTRLVWMFPMSANLVEGSFFQPLQSILMKSEFAGQFLAPWSGFETVRRLVTDTYNNGNIVAASDFSATDAHFKLATTMEVCDVLSECFQPRYRELLRESMTYMHEIPLVIGPDSKLEGEHGVSSGSNWTNFVETIFDWILSEYVAQMESGSRSRLSERNVGSPVNYHGLYAIGDDMSWFVQRSHFDPEFSTRLEEYGKQVGQEIKEDKTTNDPDKVKSLQRLFQAGYYQESGEQLRAVYPTIRALKSLVYPEKRHPKKREGKKLWDKDMNSVRAVMILENCVDHPLYRDFVAFVAAGDPYLVEFAKKDAKQINDAARRSKLIPGLNPTYNQERRDSKLSEFETIKVLASL
nr:MAG: RNA-dependent RNA polymerase [Porcine picobirnavirus]